MFFLEAYKYMRQDTEGFATKSFHARIDMFTRSQTTEAALTELQFESGENDPFHPSFLLCSIQLKAKCYLAIQNSSK